jgi:hypothetical protein
MFRVTQGSVDFDTLHHFLQATLGTHKFTLVPNDDETAYDVVIQHSKDRDNLLRMCNPQGLLYILSSSVAIHVTVYQEACMHYVVRHVSPVLSRDNVSSMVRDAFGHEAKVKVHPLHRLIQPRKGDTAKSVHAGDWSIRVTGSVLTPDRAHFGDHVYCIEPNQLCHRCSQPDHLEQNCPH